MGNLEVLIDVLIIRVRGPAIASAPNFNTSEEDPIRGSPKRLELVIRPRFMNKKARE